MCVPIYYGIVRFASKGGCNKIDINKMSDFQILDAQMSVTFDLEDLQLRPEKDVLLTEMIHAVSLCSSLFVLLEYMY